MDYTQPRADTGRSGTNDATAVSGQQDATYTTIQFTRKLSTGDPNDIAIVDGTMFLVWATGNKHEEKKKEKEGRKERKKASKKEEF